MKKSVLIIDAPDESFGGERFISLVAPAFPQIDFRSTTRRDGGDPAAAGADAIFGFGHHFTEGMLQAATSLKWIQTFTTGVDAVLKLKALRKEVILTSLRGVHGPQMSELTFLHMLALCRNYPRVLDNHPFVLNIGLEANFDTLAEILLDGYAIAGQLLRNASER